MTDWNVKRQEARAKLEAKGGAAILQRTNETYDDATDRTVTTTTNIATYVLLSTEEGRDEEGRVTDYLVALMADKPATGDRLMIGTDTHTVIRTMTIAPAGVAVLYSAILA